MKKSLAGFALIAFLLAAFVGGTAVAHRTGTPHHAPTKKALKTYSGLYHAVKDKHGKRAPGRNIRRHGIRFKWVSKDGKRRHWATRDAGAAEIADSTRQLRRLLSPPRYSTLVRDAVPPSQDPSQVQSAGYRAGGTLEAIAACESGGNPRAVDPSGTYRGKYQFDYGTWRSVGGSGDPAAASESEQDMRAAKLYAQRGAQPWPVCGR